MLYEELLSSCKERLDKFFENHSIFENQFTWSNFNVCCYERMYTNNNYDQIATVKHLKEEIPELKDICKKCGNFFMPKRNKSIPKYDIILGKQYEEALMEFLEIKLNTKIDRADKTNKSMPDCKVVKPDGTVAAYFEVKFHGAPFISALNHTGRYCYEGSVTLDYKKIEKQLNIIEELDAPVFYVHWVEFPCLKGIFYETSEQVKKYISQQHEVFERKKREGDEQKSKKAVYLKKMYSPLLNLKSFEELVEELSVLTQG